MIFIDGRDRVDCLKRVLQTGIAKDAIIVLDNTERVSGGPYAEFNDLLSEFKLIHFEQPQILGIPNSTKVDRAGWRVGHRWVTTIAHKNTNDYTSTGRIF